jgi:hypothetical protein
VIAETDSAFAPVDDILARHAERRRSTEQRLQEVFDRRAAATRKRRELQAQLEALDAEDASAAAEEEGVTGELDLLADAEAAARGRAVSEVLVAGRAALDESAATWSVNADPRDERDQDSLTAAERTVADFDAMERAGLLAQLPGAVRAKLAADAEAARATLHAMLGGRDPVRVPVVVAASADPSLALRVALPFAGRDELVPGGLHTLVAIAIAGALAETVEAVAEASLETVEHETLENGISIVQFRFSGPPPVPAEEYAEFVATSLTDLSRSSIALREAGVSIEARVELDLEPEAA